MAGSQDAVTREIIELHDVFQAYFAGSIDSLERVESALASDFTIVGTSGKVADRDQTLAALRSNHGKAFVARIATHDHKLLIDSDAGERGDDEGAMLVASYVEEHVAADGTSTHRYSTVVFSRDAAAPNGVSWRRVHETWIAPQS